MEQRNGRVDRHGQKADEVLVYHFVGKGYRERAARQFGGPVVGDGGRPGVPDAGGPEGGDDPGRPGQGRQVIAEQVEEAMLGRRTTLSTEKAEKESEPIRRMLQFERDLQKQVQALMQQYRETRKELRLSPENIQQGRRGRPGAGGPAAARPGQDPTTASPASGCRR